MDNELVAQITAEVVRQLEKLGYPNQAQKNSLHKALAIFTGGTIGLEASLAQVKSIQAGNVRLTIVLSEAAERIIGVARVKEILGADVLINTSRSSYPGKELRESDIVVIPVLTQNTAAKLAYTLADSLVPTLVLQALMLGKPVVAAANAADPYDHERRQKDMCNQPPALLAALAENLKKIQNYGIELVKADNLAAAVQRLLFRQQQPVGLDKALKKKVLDAEAVRHAVLAGEKTIVVDENTIITPLALDVARELKADILRS